MFRTWIWRFNCIFFFSKRPSQWYYRLFTEAGSPSSFHLLLLVCDFRNCKDAACTFGINVLKHTFVLVTAASCTVNVTTLHKTIHKLHYNVSQPGGAKKEVDISCDAAMNTVETKVCAQWEEECEMGSCHSSFVECYTATGVAPLRQFVNLWAV